MGAELRWILLGLGLPLLACIWWWTARRSGQAPGNAELREAASKATESAPPLDPRYADYEDDQPIPQRESRDWGVPPFEPLSIHTDNFDHVPVLDGPMMVDVEHVPAPVASLTVPSAAISAIPATPAEPIPAAATPSSRPASAAGSGSESSGRSAVVAPSASNTAESQKIVTIRVCAVGDTRWSGARLMGALELHGLAFGRYQVFHRRHTDGRSLFCVASLIEPGIFNITEMAEQEFRGVTLFAVLPGPIEPLDALNEMFATARGLAEELAGMVQDGKGMPLSPQRATALREEIARFQAMLLGS